MKRFLVVMMAIAFVLSFVGLSLAATAQPANPCAAGQPTEMKKEEDKKASEKKAPEKKAATKKAPAKKTTAKKEEKKAETPVPAVAEQKKEEKK